MGDQVRFGEYSTSNPIVANSNCYKNIALPSCNDVLNGRGKSVQSWQGNVFYHDLIQYYKLEYVVATPEEQKQIAMRIISIIRGLNPAGRFLEINQTSGTWFDIGDDKALRKIRQALREGAPEIRKSITPREIGKPMQEEMSEDEYNQFLDMIIQHGDMDCS